MLKLPSWRASLADILHPYSIDDYKGMRRRSHAIRRRRFLAFEHLRYDRKWSLPRIADTFDLDHTTVISGLRSIARARLNGTIILFLNGNILKETYRMIDLNALSKEIHANNVAAGWWPNGVDGRNIGELIALVHSEISEAYEGMLFDLKDDKLPERKMVEVEMADTVIRLLDIVGSRNYDFTKMVGPVDTAHLSLMGIHWQVTQALEGFRKGNASKAEESIIKSVYLVIAFCAQEGLDLWGAVADKRAFNAQRADHKPENRVKAGGKAF